LTDATIFSLRSIEYAPSASDFYPARHHRNPL
jgi:hypothetical protein